VRTLKEAGVDAYPLGRVCGVADGVVLV